MCSIAAWKLSKGWLSQQHGNQCYVRAVHALHLNALFGAVKVHVLAPWWEKDCLERLLGATLADFWKKSTMNGSLCSMSKHCIIDVYQTFFWSEIKWLKNEFDEKYKKPSAGMISRPPAAKATETTSKKNKISYLLYPTPKLETFQDWELSPLISMLLSCKNILILKLFHVWIRGTSLSSTRQPSSRGQHVASAPRDPWS